MIDTTTKTCGHCGHWKPSANYHYSSLGQCPLYVPKRKRANQIGIETYPDNECPSWGFVIATEEQLKSRKKAGLIKWGDD